jgi:hypothetical protein
LEVNDDARPSTQTHEGIEEKLLKSRDQKLGKNTLKITKKKNIAA